ncbi:c-type cytochrome [Corallococcus sp. ZKHCc1 1396]|uniref:C-type cytochrome n=1 Tax=Corallococcus soli TaxID=2710757 RepID=A0ABR9PUC9_9BACT|nr:MULTISPECIES: c-type cytochrome [Corallococcus]MBE4751542.1 c-type cytochrome [Corallococcus soli]MCY1030743.1 c-type cytochrome [Corallococcus sp. BB11-1]RYZ46525.1 MAG: c-type cytochrome [Myxococcaceae bacterium]
MAKTILKVLGAVVALLVVALVGLGFYGSFKLNQVVDAPLPTIAAATDPEAVKHGQFVFRAVCEDCHRQDSSGRVSGGFMKGVPSIVGRVYAANITSDKQAGIGAMSDGELARAIRYGIKRDGRRHVIMASYAMSDEDLAAVMGFMRSDHALFAPYETPHPKNEISVPGRVAMALALGSVPLDRPASGLKAPPKAPTVEYGEYLARGVYECVNCHTPGLNPSKVNGSKAFTGGFKYSETATSTVYSTNLTFHATGMGGWTQEQFARAMREGVTPAGYVMRSPMRRFRGMDDVEAEALYRFLQSLPHVDNAIPLGTAGRVKAGQEGGPEKLFASLGCGSCHAEGAKFRDMLKQSRGKPTEEVARWIRNPESIMPGTQMPTYSELLDETQAHSLAGWVQQQAALIP